MDRFESNNDRLIDLRIQLDSKLKRYLETKNDSNEENIPLRDFLKEINTLKVNDKRIYQNYVSRIIKGIDTSFIKDTSDDLQQLNKLDLLNAWRGIENNIKENYNYNNQDNFRNDENNDIQNNNDIVFAGGSIEETINVVKNFKFDTKKENRIGVIDGEVISLGNNRYEISLYRVDGGEIGKINILYNPYGNKIQIFDEYSNRLIGEQHINIPRHGHRNRNSNLGQYPSTEFNIKLNNGQKVNINLAFPNK